MATAGDVSLPPDDGQESEYDEVQLNQFALALIDTDQFWPAALMFAKLVVSTSDRPSSGMHRRCLASTFEDFGCFRSSEHQQRRVIDETAVAEYRTDCQALLGRLRESVAVTDSDVRMRNLQFECALERSQARSDGLGELERLARLTVRAVDSAQGMHVARRVVPILGQAFDEHPGSVDIGRALFGCFLALGDRVKADRLLQQLEALEPEAADVKRIAVDLAAGVASPSAGGAPQHVPNLVGVVADRLSGDDDPGTRGAVLSDDFEDICERSSRHRPLELLGPWELRQRRPRDLRRRRHGPEFVQTGGEPAS